MTITTKWVVDWDRTYWVARDADVGITVRITARYTHLERIQVDAPGLTMDGGYLKTLRVLRPELGSTMPDVARNLVVAVRDLLTGGEC